MDHVNRWLALKGMMMLKNLWFCLMFFFLVGLFPAGVVANEIPHSPIPLYPDATIRSMDYSLYNHLSLTLNPALDGKKNLKVDGNRWEMWITCPEENQTIKTYYMEMAKEHGVILSKPGVNDLHFRYDFPEVPVYVKFHAQGGKYALKILRPTSLHSQVIFGDGIFATRKSDAQSGSPEPPLISDYPQSQCTSFIYNDFNTLKLKYKIDGQWVNKTAEGRYWKKIVKMKDIPGRPRDWVSPADINETMRAAVIASNGKVLSGEDRQLVFHLEDEVAGHLWATLWPQDGKYTIKIIQEKAMEQVLVFDVDTMMARLDALGVLTLEGIFFDTAKASLRAESNEALQAAFKLLTDYPDLVMEVGGHTDNVGQAADNEKLSQDRASSVRDWLTKAGIDPSRLKAKGYGEGNPVGENETEAGRSANRRVELKKLSGGQMRDVMSLIKPYPGSEATGYDKKNAQYKLQIYMRDSAGRVQKQTIIGTGFRQYYQVLNEKGKKDEALSGVQIRHNYLQAVKDFGGTILAEESHGLYFRLDNLDGSSTYVSVWAPGSKYQVTAVTPSTP